MAICNRYRATGQDDLMARNPERQSHCRKGPEGCFFRLHGWALSVAALMMVWVLFLPSCAPRPIVASVSKKHVTAENAFASAEAEYQRRNWKRAEAEYLQYLDQFPDGRFHADALLKLGMIQRRRGAPIQARKYFERLVLEYPESPRSIDARIEIPFTYFEEGRYQAALDAAVGVEPKLQENRALLRIRLLAADAQIALGRGLDGVRSYLDVYAMAEGSMKSGILRRVEQALPMLADGEIETLAAAAPPGSLAAAEIDYESAVRSMRREKFSAAALLFMEFIQAYPSHPKAASAKAYLDQLAEKTIFRHDTIGCLLPLSGRYQMIGNRALRGIELALQHWTEAGLAAAPRLLIRDTGGDPQRASNAVRDLAAAGVAGIVGPIIAADAAAKAAQEYEIPILTLSPRDEIPAIGDYVFRNFLTSEMQAEEIVRYATQDLGLYRFAVLYPADPYGRKLMNLFWDAVLAAGGEITALESYQPGNTDFADPIKKLVGLYYDVPADLLENEPRPAPEPEPSEPEMLVEAPEAEEEIPEDEEEPEPIIDFDAVFIPDAPESSGLVLPQLAYYDVHEIYLFGTNLWHSNRLIEMAGDYVQGAIFPEGYFPGVGGGATADFESRFEAVYAQPPGFIEAVSYDAATMMFQAASRKDVRFRSEIRNALRHVQFEGVTGLTTFDATGEARRSLVLLRIIRDRFVPVQREMPVGGAVSGDTVKQPISVNQ